MIFIFKLCISVTVLESFGNTPPGGLDSINVITSALGSRSVNLREMMRRATAAVRSGSGSGASHVSRAPGEPPNEGDTPPLSSDEPIPTLSWPPDNINPAGDEDSYMDLASAQKPNTSMLKISFWKFFCQLLGITT